MSKKIVRHPNGEGRCLEDINKVHIPDLWHIAMSLPPSQRDAVLEVWYLAHDLKYNIQNSRNDFLTIK